MLAINLDVGDVVLKDGGNVDLIAMLRLRARCECCKVEQTSGNVPLEKTIKRQV